VAKPLVDSPPKRPARKRKNVKEEPCKKALGAFLQGGSFGGLPTVSPPRIAPTTVLYTDRVYIVLSEINRGFARASVCYTKNNKKLFK